MVRMNKQERQMIKQLALGILSETNVDLPEFGGAGGPIDSVGRLTLPSKLGDVISNAELFVEKATRKGEQVRIGIQLIQKLIQVGKLL